jgi:TolB protein
VAYVSARGGESPNLWVVGIDGKNSAQITANDSPDLQPHWFPDGRRLGFLSTRQDGLGMWSIDLQSRREELMLQLADDTAIAKTLGNSAIAEASLSPSMTQIVIDVVGPPHANHHIFVSPTKALAPRAVSDPSRWVGYPAWSPDETQIAVELKDGSSTHAAVLDAKTGALRRLTSETGQTWVRSWSPDGQKIAAAVFRQGRWDLRWVDATSGAMGLITAAAAPNTYVRYPEWSPRGDVVVYERGELRGNVWMLRLGRPAPVQKATTGTRDAQP